LSVRIQFTVPDESVIATISAATGGAVPALTKPTESWPVLVFQHGSGQSNSNALLIASALVMVGSASAAFDHPLHGDHIITIGDESFDSSAFNSLNLLSTRDNGHQSIADIMGLPKVSTSTKGSGVVRFIAGGHGSLISPT
jgi:hypothetical protein